MYSGLCSARIYSLLKKSKNLSSEARCVPRNPLSLCVHTQRDSSLRSEWRRKNYFSKLLRRALWIQRMLT